MQTWVKKMVKIFKTMIVLEKAKATAPIFSPAINELMDAMKQGAYASITDFPDSSEYNMLTPRETPRKMEPPITETKRPSKNYLKATNSSRAMANLLPKKDPPVIQPRDSSHHLK